MNKPLLSILIIFPEGNITNNPNLLSMILLLSRHYQIYIVIGRKNQNNLNIQIYHFFLDKLCVNKYFKKNKEMLDKKLGNVPFSLIIGIDQGIKFADYIAKERNTPIALISYEIFFKNEWNSLLKQQEIDACRDIKFAVCQDTMRSYLLSRENSIPIEKIINIPISESYNGPYARSMYLHEKLKISKEKKIALYIGSISKWTITEKLINSTQLWPEEWVLVLHPRYGIDSTVLPFIEQINNSPKVYLSSEPKNYTYELEDIICSADMGLVLYDIDISSPYTGKNILFVGLSSGKFSCFMKYCVPVIVNNSTNIADIVSKYNLGYVASRVDDIGLLLSNSNTDFLYNNCDSFFKNVLDFTLYRSLILSVIEKTINKENIVENLKNKTRLIDTRNNDNFRIEIIYDELRYIINDLNIYKDKLFRNKLRKIPIKIKKIINFFKYTICKKNTEE